MAHIHFVCGPQGAGKSTYSRQLAQRLNAVVFSIDDWMVRLYGPDMPSPLNMGWVVERVQRCERLIWQTALDVARSDGRAVLDLGFLKIAGREAFRRLAGEVGLPAAFHYVTAPPDVRRARVMQRNKARSDSYTLHVTPAMFDTMEREFEPFTEAERARATCLETQ